MCAVAFAQHDQRPDQHGLARIKRRHPGTLASRPGEILMGHAVEGLLERFGHARQSVRLGTEMLRDMGADQIDPEAS